MIVSVICAVYNDIKGLTKTIESFISQDYQDKELIIIDGGSTDGSAEVLNQYGNVIKYSISEKDKGISDAFNKGLAQVSPGYVYFLGAGDTFFENDVISKVINNCNFRSDLLVCGRVRFADENTGEVKFIAPKNISFNKRSLLFRMSLPHQGLFTSTVFFEKYGNFSLECKYAMDYELLLRAYHDFPCVIMRNIVIATWLAGGIGSNRTMDVFREYDKNRRKNNVAPSMVLTGINLWTIFKYKFKQVILNG